MILDTKRTLEFYVKKEQEGQYLTLPFEMPLDTEALHLRYRYKRHRKEGIEGSGFKSRKEVNIIDLGLINPDGEQVGASGSDKSRIEINARYATPGYQVCELAPGEWRILIGAYKVAEEGVKVAYDLTFTKKKLRVLKGDFHTHTLASDGVHTVEELAQRALRYGLDFLAITDHNQMASGCSLPRLSNLTLIPGVEWTHFRGHANFLGVDRPYEEPFFTNNFEEVQKRFRSARERGALITINHPFEEVCPFQFDIQALPWDCLEVWNGPMRVSNLQAMGLWQQLLVSGKKVPICGGSDYHRDQLFIFPGGPTTCVFAMSASVRDILDGLRQGHAYIVYAPDGPKLELKAGEAMMGDSVVFPKVEEVEIKVEGLLAGDVVQVVTGEGSRVVFQAKADGKFEGVYPVETAGFARLEVLRSFVPGLPLLPALVSNPVYFEAE